MLFFFSLQQCNYCLPSFFFHVTQLDLPLGDPSYKYVGGPIRRESGGGFCLLPLLPHVKQPSLSLLIRLHGNHRIKFIANVISF